MKWISLLIPLVVSGCIAPGITAAKCELQIQPVGRGSDSQEANSLEQRCIVVKYWYNNAVNDASAIELLDAFVTSSEKALLNYPARMYAIVWTPALGTQHLHPEPAALVFTEGCAPVFVNTIRERELCCSPPKSGLQIMSPEKDRDNGKNYWEIEQLVALAPILNKLDQILHTHQIQRHDRIMVYQQLLRSAQRSSALPNTDDRTRSSIEKLVLDLKRRIADGL